MFKSNAFIYRHSASTQCFLIDHFNVIAFVSRQIVFMFIKLKWKYATGSLNLPNGAKIIVWRKSVWDWIVVMEMHTHTPFISEKIEEKLLSNIEMRQKEAITS